MVHAATIAGLGAGYLIIQFGFGQQLAPATCRWCDPPSLDLRIRDALKWSDSHRADVLSSITGYGIEPVVVLGITALGSGAHGSWRRRLDDVVPVLESAIAVSLLQHAAKFSVGRQRPYAHYADPGATTPTQEDNLSFFSGHTSLSFGLAVSAGQVATLRGYSIAPVVWTVGLSLAATTGYLRIAADRHYFSDVVVGAAVGSAVGYIWPQFVTRYLHRDSFAVTPTPHGVAVSGAF